MDWNSNQNGTSSYKQAINYNTLPNKYNGMVKVLPTSVSQNGYNGSETRNFTQSNFNVGFTPTMTVASRTSNVPRIRPPPPSPRANVQQRKGRTENSKAALHKSMFDLRDVGQDSFQRPQQHQSMAPPTLITSTARPPGYPCYDRHSLNLSYQDLRAVGSVPQVQQQSMHSQVQNTQYSQQNRFSFNTGMIDNGAFPTANSAKKPDNQYFKPQLPPTPVIHYTQPVTTPVVNTQNDDMKSLHDDMAQLRLELASMKDFMREEEEFQSKQVQELKQLQIQFHESSKLIQEQKPKMEKEQFSQSTPKFNSLPIITASPNVTLLPPKSPKPTLLVKPSAPSKASPQHPDFSSMKTPIQELEQRFNMQRKQEENLNKQSQQAIEPKKLPPSKPSSIPPEYPKATHSHPPKSPKPVTSTKPLISPSSQLRRSHSVTPTNPSQQYKPTKPNQIVFPKTGPLIPPTKPELPAQMNGDKNNNYPIVPSNNYSGETKSKPVESSNAKVKRISQMFEGNLNEINENGPQQKNSPHYDLKIGGGTIRKLSPALLQSIQASEESKISGTHATSRHIPKSTSLKSNFEASKLETTNISRDLSESSRVPPILKSSPALSHVSSASKPSVILSSSSLKSSSPSIEPPSVPPVKLPQPKKASPVSQTPVLPPSPPPASLKPSTIIQEPPPPQYKEEINSPYSSQIPYPDDNISEQISTSFAYAPESPQTTLARYANIPEPEHDYQENVQVTPDNSILPPTSEIATYKHRYENVSESEQDISVPDYSPPLPPKDFLPDHSTSEDFNEELANQQDRISAIPQATEIRHPQPTPSFSTINSIHDKPTGTSQSSAHHQRKTSIPVIIRPSTAPPPPPPTSVQTEKTEQPKLAPQTSSPTLPITSPSSPPPPPPIPTEKFIPSPPPPPPIPTEKFIPSPPPPPPPENILENKAPPNSLSIHRRSSSSGISSTASIPGSPLSPVETKSHLLEQIRQFKQSGKGLKKANENEELNGTPTRVRRNSIQDALLTRFKAFSGDQSESSEDEHNNVEDDWED